MVEGSGQENKSIPQDDDSHGRRIPLTLSLGTRLTVALAVFSALVGVVMLLIVAGLVWYSLPVFGV